jgi:hypothetical protein
MQTVSLRSSKRAPVTVRIGDPAGEIAKVLLKRVAEPGNSDHVKRAVAQPMIAPFECNDTGFPAVEQRGFDRDLHSFKT